MKDNIVSPQMEFTFTVSVGRLIRDRVRHILKQIAFVNDCKINIESDDGFFESLYMVRISGEAPNVESARNDVNRFKRSVA